MERTVDKHVITTTNEEVIWFPQSKITKGEVIDYYEKIAPYMVPHMYNRAVTMHRYVDGIKGEDFYQKNAGHISPNGLSAVR